MGVPTGLRNLSLFTGAISPWATRLLGWQEVCYVEWDEYCQRVIMQRIADGWFDDAPIWDDVRTFDGKPWRGRVDVITAGFPCQPFSVAGKQRAGDDERNGWPHTARIIREVAPRYVVLENVPGLLAGSHGYWGEVLGELAEIGFDAVWGCLSAEQAGANHVRDRLWCLAVANTDSQRELQSKGRLEQERRWPCDGRPSQGHLANANCPHGQGVRKPIGAQQEHTHACGAGWWQTEPDVGRVVDGCPNWSNRLRALGNGWVPAQAAMAVQLLWERAEQYGLT